MKTGYYERLDEVIRGLKKRSKRDWAAWREEAAEKGYRVLWDAWQKKGFEVRGAPVFSLGRWMTLGELKRVVRLSRGGANVVEVVGRKKPWRVRAKGKHVGYFETKEQALAVYERASRA